MFIDGVKGAAIELGITKAVGWVVDNWPSGTTSNFDTDGELGPEIFSAKQQAAIKEEIALAVSDAPKEGFASEVAAAKYLRSKLQPIAENYDIEIGSYIFSDNGGGSFHIYEPMTGFYNHTIPRFLQPPRLGHAPFHIHQTGASFSGIGGDISIAEQSRANSYLSNTKGLFRYRSQDFREGYYNGGSRKRRDYVDNLGK